MSEDIILESLVFHFKYCNDTWLLDIRLCNAVCINNITPDSSEEYLWRMVWNSTQGRGAVLLVYKGSCAPFSLVVYSSPKCVCPPTCTNKEIRTNEENITSQVCAFKPRRTANNHIYNFQNASTFIGFL